MAAAGSGRRMGGDKVFLAIRGRPVLSWTLAAVAASGVADRIVVAVRPGCEAAARALGHDVEVVTGGAERAESVSRALAVLGASCDRVLIHDGARPLASPGLFVRVAAAVAAGAGATAALPVADSLHRASGERVGSSVDRAGLWSAQTPQGFDCAALRSAVAWGAGRSWTDEAGLFIAWGGTVRLVEGEAMNLKLTRPSDVPVARGLLGAAADRRVGYGWDVHRLAAGRRLVLGGVELTRRDGLGLEGHSDADAVAHAIADAVLGAAARGDIGQHFPPGDPAYAGMDSLRLLNDVSRLVAADGWSVVNVDATVVADEPRLSPHVALMRERLAGALGVETGRVSVKATTTEGMTPGAIAAHAVALLERGA